MAFPVALLAYGFYANHVDAKNELAVNNSISSFEDENETTSFPLLTDQFIQDGFESLSTDFSEIENIGLIETDLLNNEFAINPANGIPMTNGISSLDMEGNPYGTDFSDDLASTFDDPFDTLNSFDDISSFDDPFMS